MEAIPKYLRMQKKIILIILLFQICINAIGQNLIPNSSFENYGTLPCGWIMSQGGYNSAMQNWMMPTYGTPDIFSTLVPINCFAHCLSTNSQAHGSQLPRTGNVMSSILTYGTGCVSLPNYREYIEVMLTSPLITGNVYYAEMYVSHTDYSKVASNNIGMYFSDTFINFPSLCTTLNYIPQINENSIITNDTGWVLISGTFTATSPAQYLIVGNFYNDINTDTAYFPTHNIINSRYFVDDFSLIDLSPCIVASDDTTICEGSSATLLAQGNLFIGWAVDSLPNVIISTDSLLLASPSYSTTYLAYSNCDTISVVVNVIPSPIVNLGNDTILCQGQTLNLSVNIPGANYVWQDGLTSSNYQVLQQGIYWVEATTACGVVSDTIQVNFNVAPFVNLGNDTTLCTGQYITLDASAANIDVYQWQDNSSNATLTISQQGIYWVQASSICGIASDTIQVIYNQAPFVNLGNDTTLCQGQILNLDATIPNATYLWQDNANTTTYSITQQGTYWLTITLNNCSTGDTIVINYNNALPVVDLGNDTTLCEGQNITLNTFTPSATYLWQDNSTLPNIIAMQEGIYFVQVTNSCGVSIDSVHLYFNPLPLLSISNIVSPSCFGFNNGSATVAAQGTGALSYFWNTGLANGATINQATSGNYTVTVYDAIGCSSAMNVNINEPDSISANIQTSNAICAIDNGSAQISSTGGTGVLTYLWSNNASSNIISDLPEGTYAVSVTDSLGCVKVLSATIIQTGLFTINAGIDQQINYGDAVELIAVGPENANYSWWPLDYLTCSECSSTVANPIATTEFILTVIKDGCKVIDTVTVIVDQKCNDLFVPTAFSPNNDLVNNIFVVRGNCISEINFKIFDRWGQVIFESNDQNIGWDGTFKGKALNEGIYVYTFNAVVKGESIFQKGNFTLMRN
jgi:gliding motility-associated-like protein